MDSRIIGKLHGQNHVVLGEGILSPTRGLIGFHFFNDLGLTATLNFGIDPDSTATYGSLIGAVSIGTAQPYVLGARATQTFLNKYVPISGLPAATPRAGAAQPPPANVVPYLSISPKKITSWSVPTGQTISGEFELPNLSKSATFYLYACTASCTSPYTAIATPDPNRQRAYFPKATYLVHYDYTPAYIPNGGSAFEIVGSSGCTPNLAGTDLLDPTPGPHATLEANFAVPIDIYGAAQISALSQRLGVNPRGGFPYIGAAWVARLINPKTDATVSPTAYVLPTTTPSPLPTSTQASIPNNTDSAFLGFDKGGGHTIIYILPGGNSSPVLMWDYVVTPVPAAPIRRISEVRHASN